MGAVGYVRTSWDDSSMEKTQWSGMRLRRGLGWHLAVSAVGALLVAGCAGSPDVEPQETIRPATADDYAAVVESAAPAIELAAEDQGCFLDIVLGPDTEEARECINRASVAVSAMQAIQDQFDELGWPDAPPEIFNIGSRMHLAAVLITDEDGEFNVDRDCSDPSSDDCASTAGAVIKAMGDTVEPLLADWDDVGP